MNIFFLRKRLTVARLIIASMDMGYIIRLRGRDTYIFILHDDDKYRECEFNVSELRDAKKRKVILKTLADEAESVDWRSAQVLNKNA